MRTQVVIDLDFDEGRGELTVRVGASERILLTEGTTGPLTALLSALLEERPPVWLQSAGELVSCSQTFREGAFWPVSEIGVPWCLKEPSRIARRVVQTIGRHAERLEEGR